MKVNGKDDIPYMKWKNMFETTSQTEHGDFCFGTFCYEYVGGLFAELGTVSDSIIG
jgi:hypothetical protein